MRFEKSHATLNIWQASRNVFHGIIFIFLWVGAHVPLLEGPHAVLEVTCDFANLVCALQ